MSGVTFSVSCSVCGRTVPEGEDMMNPIGDPNWYCIDCWKAKQQKEREEKERENNDQILADTDFNKYYLIRARCEVCKTKTWYFVWLKYYEWDIIGLREPLTHNEGVSKCIEHSWADDNDRYLATHYTLKEEESNLFKTIKRGGQSFSFAIQYDPDSPFIKWARDMILQQDPQQQSEEKEKEKEKAKGEIKLYE